MLDWVVNFKKDFEDAGVELHTGPFIVDWSHDPKKPKLLVGKIEGENQELTHDVEFTVTLIHRHLPLLYDIHWKSIGLDGVIFVEDIGPGGPRQEKTYKLRAIVNRPWLAAAAIHYNEGDPD